MKLQELLKDVVVKNSTAAQDIEIKEVRYDSRAVQPGDLFVAIRGYATDGHKYIAKAMEQGAAAVVCEEAPEGVPAVVVENSRIALAEIAANRFGHPAESMVMLGVTGTNGKTTTTYLVKHMLEDAGHKVGLIGTNQNLIGDEVIETERTTPESYELHALFARMRDAGCTHVIMEVSSHSLVLDRVHGIPFAVGAFTNLTQDHLDFHKTMEEYRKAKALLFSISKKGVINLDDAAAEKMLADAKCPCMTFSCGKPEADLEATDLQLHADGVGLMTNYGGVYLGDRRLDELMAELDGRGALTVMHPTQPAVMVPDVNEEIPLPAFEYFVETTRAFLNMAQNDTFTLYPNIRWVVPHAGAFLSILADRFESFALMLRFADPDRRADIMEDMAHAYYDAAGFFLSRSSLRCCCAMSTRVTCSTAPTRPIPTSPPASGRPKLLSRPQNSPTHRNRSSLPATRCCRS